MTHAALKPRETCVNDMATAIRGAITNKVSFKIMEVAYNAGFSEDDYQQIYKLVADGFRQCAKEYEELTH